MFLFKKSFLHLYTLIQRTLPLYYPAWQEFSKPPSPAPVITLVLTTQTLNPNFRTAAWIPTLALCRGSYPQWGEFPATQQALTCRQYLLPYNGRQYSLPSNTPWWCLERHSKCGIPGEYTRKTEVLCKSVSCQCWSACAALHWDGMLKHNTKYRSYQLGVRSTLTCIMDQVCNHAETDIFHMDYSRWFTPPWRVAIQVPEEVCICSESPEKQRLNSALMNCYTVAHTHKKNRM